MPNVHHVEFHQDTTRMPSSRLNNGEQTRVNYSEIGRCQGPQGFRKIAKPGMESPTIDRSTPLFWIDSCRDRRLTGPLGGGDGRACQRRDGIARLRRLDTICGTLFLARCQLRLPLSSAATIPHSPPDSGDWNAIVHAAMTGRVAGNGGIPGRLPGLAGPQTRPGMAPRCSATAGREQQP